MPVASQSPLVGKAGSGAVDSILGLFNADKLLWQLLHGGPHDVIPASLG